MTAYLMLFSMSFLSWLSLILTKKFQLGMKISASYLFQANFYSAIVACLCLFFANKCVINVNGVTLAFAFVYGFFSTISLFFTIYSYSRISMTLTSIIGSAGGIIVPMVFGFFLNNEPVGFRLILSALLMLAAAVLPVIKDVSVASGKKFIWFLALYFVYAGLPNILSKLYAQNDLVTDTISYFFLTNAFMLLICIVGMIVTYIHSRKTGNFDRITLPHIANCGTRTVMSLFSSYLSIAILTLIPVSLYAVLLSSLNLIGNALISRFVFKERMSKTGFISLLLAIASFATGR